jgi:putative PIN family toxin of toxin-antitoxin system
MRAVLDTVVYVRAMINRQSRWGRLVFTLAERYTVVYSREMIEEVLEALGRTELRNKFPQINDVSITTLITLFGDAELVQQTQSLDVSRDPTDNKFFECAVAGRADYIVSEDRDILDVGEYEGIKMDSVAEFLEILSGETR